MIRTCRALGHPDVTERDPTPERADVVIDGTHPVERSRSDRHASSHPTPLPSRRNAAQAEHRTLADPDRLSWQDLPKSVARHHVDDERVAA